MQRRTKREAGAVNPGAALLVEGGGVVEDGLNDVQRAVVVIIIGGKTRHRLDAVGGVGHRERVFHQLEHFRIVSAVANGHARLRRDAPALQQAADAVGFMQAGDN